MSILITGGAGFIGSSLAIRLSQDCKDIVIIDRETDPTNLHEILPEITYHHKDVRDSRTFEDTFMQHRIRGVIHLAAVSRVIWGEQNPSQCFDVNVNGTATLVNAIRASGSRPWVIFGSSREVYGEPQVFPVSEDHRRHPINVYGRTKVLGENLIKDLAKGHGLCAGVLRFSNVYGNEKDIPDRVIPRFIMRALGGNPVQIHGGSQSFDFTHIEDTVDGIIRMIHYLEDRQIGKEPVCEDFHLLPGEPCSLQRVVQLISGDLGREVPIEYTSPRTYDVERFHGNPSKAFRDLGFRAQVDIKTGIHDTIERYQEVLQG